MPSVRPSLRTVSFVATFVAGLLAGNLAVRPAAAQDQTPSMIDDPTVDTLASGVASRLAAGQPQRLEQMLERYRDIEARGGWGRVPTDVVIGPGQNYDCRRIAMVEKRLIAEGYLDHASPPPPPPPVPAKAPPPKLQPVRADQPLGLAGPCPYTRELTDAVRAFQADRKVLGFGQLGKQTMAELNRPVQEIVELLEQDVARWKRRGIDPHGTYLLVNIPFFEMSVVEDDREEMRISVVVGQPTWQTPQFSDELEYIVVNPDWGIPEKIAKQEYLPSARRDPNYLRWQGITNTGGSLRQKPGPRNPLGRIKFVMPNENDVYLHDTPEKRAFNAKVRALSHGCVRLSRPLDLANYLLRDEASWDPRRLQAAISSGQTRQINLRRRMPVHIVYSTTRVNEAGRLEIRPDVYRKNRRALTDEERAAHRSDESVEAWP